MLTFAEPRIFSIGSFRGFFGITAPGQFLSSGVLLSERQFLPISKLQQTYLDIGRDTPSGI